MSYTPTTWKDGDLVTSAKLNKLEQGVANGGSIQIIHAQLSEGTTTLDKTWQEIHDGGFGVIILEDDDVIGYELIIMVADLQIHTLAFAMGDSTAVQTYTALSADAYPSFKFNGGNKQ